MTTRRDGSQREPLLRVLALTAALWAIATHAHQLIRFLHFGTWWGDFGVPYRDFDHLYVASRLLLNARVDIYQLSESSFRAAAAQMGVPNASPWTNYAPSTFVAFWPLAQVPYALAKTVWLALTEISLAALMCAPLWLTTASRRVRGWLTFTPFLVLAFFPVQPALVLGQPTLLMVALVGIAAALLQRRHPWLGGVVLALATVWKCQTHLVWLYLLARRQWKTALLGVGATALLEGVAVWRGGWGLYAHWWALVQQQLGVLRGVGWENFALQDVLARVAGVSPTATLVSALCLALLLGTLVWVWRTLRRSGQSFSDECAYGISLLLIITLLLTPRTSLVHLPLLLLPFLLWWSRLLEAPGEAGWFILCYVLLGVRFSLVQFPAFAAGPLALVAGVKTAAIAVLGWAMLRSLSRPSSAIAPAAEGP